MGRNSGFPVIWRNRGSQRQRAGGVRCGSTRTPLLPAYFRWLFCSCISAAQRKPRWKIAAGVARSCCLFFLHSNRLAPMRSTGRDMSSRQPLTIEQRPKLYRLTVEHCAAGIEPFGFFVGREDHFSRLPGCDGCRRNASSSAVGLSVVVRPVAPTCRGYAGHRG